MLGFLRLHATGLAEAPPRMTAAARLGGRSVRDLGQLRGEVAGDLSVPLCTATGTRAGAFQGNASGSDAGTSFRQLEQSRPEIAAELEAATTKRRRAGSDRRSSPFAPGLGFVAACRGPTLRAGKASAVQVASDDGSSARLA